MVRQHDIMAKMWPLRWPLRWRVRGLLGWSVIMIIAALMWSSMPARAQQFKIAADPNAPIDIRAEALDVVEAHRRALFSGQVDLRQSGLSLVSQNLNVHWRPDGTLQKARAEGDVVLRTAQNQIIRGQWAEYDFNQLILRMGNAVTVDLPPSPDQDGTRLTGQLFTADLREGTGTLSGGKNGRVKGVLRPLSKP